MFRARALVNAVFANVRYQGVGNLVPTFGVRFLAVAASADSPAVAGNPVEGNESQRDAAEQVGDRPREQLGSRPPLRFGTLEFLLKRRMPINSVRLLTQGVRLACNERRSEAMVPFLGPWLAQLTRPDNLERLSPWSICDVLRDLVRLSKVAGYRTVRDALPPKHLQTLANRLVVQGFDKLTPYQLARAAEAFSMFRPFLGGIANDQGAVDSGATDTSAQVSAWPSSDWVDELVDWLHNLKPNIEPWPRTTPWSLSNVLLGLARSNYKPRQPTFQAAATAMKAKLEDQIQSGYLSRSAIINATTAWNIWRVNPEEYAPGYWDVHFKTVAQLMEEYVDSIPDPPSLEDAVAPDDDTTDNADDPRRRRFGGASLYTKRREFRNLLSSVASSTKAFNLTKQFDETVRAIWERRVDDQARWFTVPQARRILQVSESLGISLKPQTKEKLVATTNQPGLRHNREPLDRDIDDFDDLRGGPTRNESVGRSRGPGGARSGGRDETLDDFDDFDPQVRNRKIDRGGPRTRREGDFDFDDKPF